MPRVVISDLAVGMAPAMRVVVRMSLIESSHAGHVAMSVIPGRLSVSGFRGGFPVDAGAACSLTEVPHPITCTSLGWLGADHVSVATDIGTDAHRVQAMSPEAGPGGRHRSE